MKISLGIGESKPISIAGAQFYLLSASEKVRVRLISGGDARSFDLSAGMGFKDFENHRWGGVEITNLGEAAQEIEFEISDQEVFDNRVTFGNGGSSVPVVVNGDASKFLKTTKYVHNGATYRLGLAENGNRSSVSFVSDFDFLMCGGSEIPPLDQRWPVRSYEVVTIKTKDSIWVSSGTVGGVIRFLEEVY